VRDVAFNFAAQDQVTLRGLAVGAAFQLSGVDLTIAPGQAMGALSAGAAPSVLPVVSEEWVDL
jgi:hypothetical protein